MRIAIIGAGAIGCVTGALLHETGHDVTLVGREDQVSAIKSGGLVIDGAGGERRLEMPVSSSLTFGPDIVALAVKTQDVEEALGAAQQYLANAVILTMQNGVSGDELAAKVIGRERLVSSVVMYGATYLSPGRVTYNFPGGLVIGGAFPDCQRSNVEVVRDAFSGAFDVTVSGDIHGTHWTKLILNLNNAVAGALGLSLQESFSDDGVCRLGLRLMKEAYDTMSAAGIDLAPLPDLPVDRLVGLLNMPLDAGAGIYGNIMRGLSDTPLPGSVLQSIMRGKTSEVDSLNGEIIRLGAKYGVNTPLNARITGIVHEVERTGRFIGKDELLRVTG